MPQAASHITERSIQAVRDVSVSDVVRQYISINSKGFACCPFHGEKSPSFKVSDNKGIFKCFGCGASGDAIEFVMKKDKLNFIESVEKIASLMGIRLEYDQIANPEEYEAAKKKKLSLLELVDKVVGIYRQQLWQLNEDHPVKQYIRGRKLTDDEIAEWQIGWATSEWKFLSSRLINDGQFEPAHALGLIRRTADGESNYDAYRSRILFPIKNHLGQYIGLGGRFFEMDPADKDRQNPKYINPNENELYSKSNVLYGLAQAAKSITERKFAILVEGYMDVISMHKNGDTNTVGTCGTALTIDQAKLLKRYTGSVLILRDGDGAGMKAAIKDIHILLKQEFKVEIAILPDGKDPDDYVSSFDQPTEIRSSGLEIQDAVLWRTNQLIKEGAGDITAEATARLSVLDLLAHIPNAFIRNNYFDTIARIYKWKKPKDYLKQLENLVISAQGNQDSYLKVDIDDDLESLANLPEWMDKEEFMKQGYCAVRNKNRIGYYSFSSSGKVEITNFLITPLFHVFAGKDSRHLIQIDNGRVKAVLDVESKVLVSIDLMQQYLVAHGAFIFYGNKNHLLRIATDLLGQFPMCYEIKALGWQTDNFYAWVNKSFVIDEGLKDYDNWGILNHADKNFLVPAACEAYRELQKTGEDPYEPDRPLTWIQPKFSFSHWADLMSKVYKEKGIVAVAYVFLTVFRDIVFDVDNNCPHLYGFGERTAGKSKWAESVGAVFFFNRPAFNLNSGTDFAFFDYISRFKNTTALLNEFDEKVIKEEWFQAIKGFFDGESRQRGKIGGGKRGTETMHIKSTIILTGQYLCTMDDNSIVSRSIIEAFNEREYTEQEKKWYEELKDAEGEGITGLITEVLKYRKEFKSLYKENFNQYLSQWRKEIDTNQVNFNQRIMQNWCHLLTCYSIMNKYLALPMDVNQFREYCKEKAIHWSNFIRASDTLSDFWNTLSFLLERGDIVEGWDYKIEQLTEVSIRDGKTKKDFTHHFNQPTKVLFIRLNNIHKHYEQIYRQRTGKTAMTLENLLHYFSSRKYFVGSIGKTRFTKWINTTKEETRQFGQTSKKEAVTGKEKITSVTSAYMFLYDALNIDLERQTMPEHETDGPDAAGLQAGPDLPF